MVDDDHVCLIRNFRLAVCRWLVEIPAGTLEPGEPPLDTAARELIEETGYRAAQLMPLCELLFSPGILHERMHLFLATQLTPGETRLEVGEQIERLIVPWEEALEMIRRGEIEDAKTVAALLFCDRWLRNKHVDARALAPGVAKVVASANRMNGAQYACVSTSCNGAPR